MWRSQRKFLTLFEPSVPLTCELGGQATVNIIAEFPQLFKDISGYYSSHGDQPVQKSEESPLWMTTFRQRYYSAVSIYMFS